MNIAMLSKSDRSGGGASRVAEDLSIWLKEESHLVHHFTRSSKFIKTFPLYNKFAKIMYHRLRSIGFQEIIPFEKKQIIKYDKNYNYDIFHFHDLSTAISPLTLKWLSDKKRNVLWTIHDCSIVTGGCIYPLSCEKYTTTCQNCPQLGDFPLAKNLDLTFLFHRLKKYIHKHSNIHYIAPSKWMADFAYNTGYLKNYPTIIHNAVDTEIFKNLDKIKTRKELDIPIDRFYIMLSAGNIFSKFKGIKYAIKTLKMLKKIKPYVIIQGELDKKNLYFFDGIDIHLTGYIEDKKMQNKYFAAADIFLNTTIQDNFPLTVLESIASGTPNVGFATGGIPEMVDSGKNGFLTNDKSPELLAREIEKIYQSKIYKIWAEQSRKKAIDCFNKTNFTKKHLELYEKLNF